MNICVTGGAGFIGSHLVDALIALGHRVLVIDSLVTGVKEFVNPNAQFLEMDVRDSRIEDVFQEFKPDYVFHEAAQTMVPESMKDPAYDCDVNLMGLINILNACVKTKVKKVLTPSSAAIYGDLDTLPLTESMSGIPSSFYGLTKLTTEHYLRLYQVAFGLPCVCFRYSNVYGPRQGDGGEGGVISIFARLASEGKQLTVFGDGEQTRDFIFVDDVVRANILGMEKDVTGIFNVSTNVATSVNELIRQFNVLAGRDMDVVYTDERPGDIRHSLLDTKKAENELGFTFATPLADGLAKTWAYFEAERK